MRSFDIFFKDLVPETQKEVLEFLKLEKPANGNLDIFPLTMISQEDVKGYNETIKERNRRKK